ncbi:MAG: excinuclease ABC subunit UvrC [Actinomycetaceae bacterium]|nr:excinuclease ABC subunit UvrC [Actinomycetaceae bacterium]
MSVAYRPQPGEIPTDPGVYRFLDERGQVLYVGKAKNLRNRLSSYFGDPKNLNPRIAQMVHAAAAVRWTVVSSEVESLALEYAWIKEFEPRFNVMFRDDKSYPYLALTLNEKFPRVFITRGVRRTGVKYFGPYTKVWAIRETLELLQRPFPIRTCTKSVFNRAVSQARPCLLGYIDRCSAPCVGKISPEAHYQLARSLSDFMSGKTGPILADLEKQMRAAAKELDFEKAAKLRDTFMAAKTVLEKNTVVLSDGTDVDIFGIAASELEVGIAVFYVRGGRIRGERAWVSERAEGAETADLMEKFLEQVYGDYQADDTAIEERKSVDDMVHTSTSALPRQIWVPTMPTGAGALEKWLSKIRGGPVTISVRERGDKKALSETVSKNAAEALRLHQMRRIGDLTERSKALEELAAALDLERAPLRIEGFDISHTSGTNQVGSMVVFEDGAPRKSAYRHFTIRENEGADDTAAMQEVLRRRLQRLLAEEAREERESGGDIASAIDPETGRLRRFSYRPDLLVVDGGLPQVRAAAAVVTELAPDIPLIGLAKRLEEVWLPEDDYPIILPRTSSALFLLQHLRDESHRFAITHHRKKRAKQMTRSVLDKVTGLGPSRQVALLKKFGSVAKMRKASAEELMEVPGVGPKLAAAIQKTLGEVGG